MPLRSPSLFGLQHENAFASLLVCLTVHVLNNPRSKKGVSAAVGRSSMVEL